MYFQRHIDIPVLPDQNAEIPCYASEGASGADVKAFINEAITIPPGSARLIPTGLRLAVPMGYEIQIRPRSGLALKHAISVLNTPGTVDADYRGEVGVILINHGQEDFVVQPDMRIAQFVLAPVCQANFIIAENLAETVRGSGGFGHTGFR